MVGFDPALVRARADHGAARRVRHRDRARARLSARRSRCGCVRGRLAAPASFIAGLGYAVPGTVLALGLLSPLVAGR